MAILYVSVATRIVRSVFLLPGVQKALAIRPLSQSDMME